MELFKHSLLQHNTLSLSPPPFPTLRQFSADNADSNTSTLDGTGTFHGMGMIMWYPRQHSQQMLKERIRQKAIMKVAELTYNKGVSIKQYQPPPVRVLSTLKFKPIKEMWLSVVIPQCSYYSKVLWSSAKLVSDKCPGNPNWTNWSGFMRCVYRNKNKQQNVDEVVILPIIDMNPSDESCIFSTLSVIFNLIIHK